jgi:NADH dehydrogenase
MKVLVLGGAGFIGRFASVALRRRGHELVIGTRAPAKSLRRLPTALHGVPAMEIHVERLVTADAWLPVLGGFDVVVNCVGILRQRWRETYDQVHRAAPAALADACIRAGIRRLIHVSALGLTADSSSGFIRSKHAGERELLCRQFDAVIVRPSLLDGPGGFGARWLRRVATWPMHFVPATAGRIAPLDVADLGLAIARLCEAPPCGRVRSVELGGAASRTMAEHLAALRGPVKARAALVVFVPIALARIASHVCDLLHVTPFSYGHLLLMQHDNVPVKNELVDLIGETASDPRQPALPYRPREIRGAGAFASAARRKAAAAGAICPGYVGRDQIPRLAGQKSNERRAQETR